MGQAKHNPTAIAARNGCPNGCGEMVTTKCSDVIVYDTYFDIWITYCPKCRYVESCEVE